MKRSAPREDSAPPSKSQRKRQHAALQAAAEQLAHWAPHEWAALGLGAATWAALEETARITDRRARRRHYKRIAQCLAHEDIASLNALLAQRDHAVRTAQARLHQAEQWRARLLTEGDAALSAFLAAYPGAARQPLRALIRTAQRDAAQGKTDAPRRLLRFVRAILEQTELEETPHPSQEE